MGIKGLYNEIGPGRRISLCKLAVEHLETTGRPFCLAIDVAIWQFQAQAAKGGANPAIRTLFYRLVRLLSLPIQPIFVFDGPNKPVFKRDKRTGRGDGVANAMAKRLIRLFGFHVHDAPGEAEAECALLQQHGIVDAVLSEDVDTIMFGCTRTLRNWSSDGTKGNKAPTHISMYDTAGLNQSGSGLDREGMVLVALLSGGDYVTAGLPGFGTKVACEAARAGFGKSLCRLKKSNAAGVRAWKDSLLHELRTNEHGYFKTRHKALSIPEKFPDFDILRYYTHPVVSQTTTLENVRTSFPSERPVDILGLRDFVGETFDWTHKLGAVKFIRIIAPSLLVQKILSSSRREGDLTESTGEVEETESAIAHGITNRRCHFSTDATPELRVSYTPSSIVVIDLDKEPEEMAASYGRNGLALNSDDEFDEQIATDDLPQNATKKSFNPLQSDVVWVPESIAKLGLPLTVEDWEEKQRAKVASRLAPRTPKRTAAKKLHMPNGALDRYLKTTKGLPLTASQGVPSSSKLPSPAKNLLPQLLNPEPFSQQLRDVASTESAKPLSLSRSKRSKPKDHVAAARPSSQTNPWTLAGSQTAPRITKCVQSSQTIVLSSSPPGPSSSPFHSPMRRGRSTQTNNIPESSPPSPLTGSPHKQRSSLSSKAQKGRPRSDSHDQKPESDGRLSTMEKESRQMSIKNFGSSTLAGRSQVTAMNLGKAAMHDVSVLEISSDEEEMVNAPASDSRELEYQVDETAISHKLVVGPLKQSTSVKDGLRYTTKSLMTKVYIPRTSEVGFYKEVEMTRDEAEQLGTSQGQKSKGKVWRHSELAIVDLTGED